MFREMARIKQQISRDECVELLKSEKRGVLSVLGDDGYPYGVPINHFYNEEDGHLYFHGGMSGHRVDAALRCDKASFCVYDKGRAEPGGWALTVRSVIVFGRLRLVNDRDKCIDISRRLCYKFTSDEQYISDEIARSGARTLVFELVPEHMTGKRVSEK